MEAPQAQPEEIWEVCRDLCLPLPGTPGLLLTTNSRVRSRGCSVLGRGERG